MAKYRMQLLVCGGTGWKEKQSDDITDNLRLEIEALALENEIQVIAGCFGLCDAGPVVKVMADETIYTRVAPEDAAEIVSQHIAKGKRVERLLYRDPNVIGPPDADLSIVRKSPYPMLPFHRWSPCRWGSFVTPTYEIWLAARPIGRLRIMTTREETS